MREAAIAALLLAALGAGLIIVYRPHSCVRLFGYWIALHHSTATDCPKEAE